VGEEEREKRITFSPSKYHACGYLIFLLRESLREEKITVAGKREEGGRGGRWRYQLC